MFQRAPASRAAALACHAVAALRAASGVRRVVAALAVSSTLLAGCGRSAVNRGADLYAQGHYVESAEVFEHTQPVLAGLDGKQRARYGLYRGAALLSLGDVGRATEWLSYCQRLVLEGGVALSSREGRMLRHTLGVAQQKAVLRTARFEGRVAATH